MMVLTEEVLCGVRFIVCIFWKMINLLAQTFEVPCKIMQKKPVSAWFAWLRTHLPFLDTMISQGSLAGTFAWSIHALWA